MVRKGSKAVIVFLLCVILLVNFVDAQADIQTYPQCTQAVISHPIVVQGALSSAVLANITIFYPNKTVLINFSQMTYTGNEFIYILNRTQTCVKKGTYTYDIFATNGVYNDTKSFKFLIDLDGIAPSNERTNTLTRSVWIFFVLGIITFISLFFVRRPAVRITMLILTIWFIIFGINLSFLAIQDEIVNPAIENFMSFFTTVSFIVNQYILYVLIIFWLVIFFANLFAKKKKQKEERYGSE